MKVYIFSDMEGVSGIARPEYTDPASPKYAEGRALLTADMNAAIAGCFDGGATEVVARDAHWSGDNFISEDIDARATIDHGARGQWWGCLDRSFDAAMIVGQHAMAGTVDAFLDHTQSSTSWYEFRINGKLTGEIGQFAAMAGHFGVPVVMLSGDRAATVEAKRLLGAIEVASVKYGVGRQSAVCLAPKKARSLIHDAAMRGVKLSRKIKPYRPRLPMVLTVRFTRADHADECAFKPGNRRLDARTVRRTVKDALHLFDFMMDTRPAK